MWSTKYYQWFVASISREKTDKNTLCEQLPWWLLVSFGSYCLWSLGFGLYTFRDCPEAHRELLEVKKKLLLVL
jgi:hypothetical protein